MSESKEETERDQQRNEYQSPESSEGSNQREQLQRSNPTGDGTNQGEQDHGSSSDAAADSNDTRSTTDRVSGSVETRCKDDSDATNDELDQILQSILEYYAESENNHYAGTAPLPDDIKSKMERLLSGDFQKKIRRQNLAGEIGINICLLILEKFGKPESGDYGIGKFAKRVGIGRNRAGSIFRVNSKAILNLKVSDIADYSYALGVTPGVLIGALTEDEQETIDALRKLDEDNKNAVRQIIDSLSRLGHDAASGTGIKSSSEGDGL